MLPSALLLLVLARPQAQTVDHDLIYMKSGGAAFTMDAFRPEKPNGKAVVFVVSGGWVSTHQGITPILAAPFNAAGITVFEVVHGAQPRYKIPEIKGQISRAMRYVRANASNYGVDPKRIGIFGMSAGGHLSLMAAVQGDDGDPEAKDPVDRVSSRPNAIVAFFPPTDFLNFGGPDRMPLDQPMMVPFRGAFPIKPGATSEEAKPIAKEISPIYGVTRAFPPTLLVHGDKDPLVPLQQSQSMDAALAAAGVKHRLDVVPGGGHGGAAFLVKIPDVVAWFQTELNG